MENGGEHFDYLVIDILGKLQRQREVDVVMRYCRCRPHRASTVQSHGTNFHKKSFQTLENNDFNVNFYTLNINSDLLKHHEIVMFKNK